MIPPRAKKNRPAVDAGGGGGGGPALWSTVFAGLGAGATINVTEPVLLDIVTPDYGPVTINAPVTVSRLVTTALYGKSIDVGMGGSYKPGTIADPYPRNAGITHGCHPSGLRTAGNDPQINDMLNASLMNSNRGLMAMMDGEVSFVSAVPAVTIFKLAQTLEIGHTVMHASQSIDYVTGDQWELTTTKFYSEAGVHREIVTATASGSGTAIPITAATGRHYGLLQYVVAPPNEQGWVGSRLSLTMTAIVAGDSFGTTAGGPYLGQRVLNTYAMGTTNIVDNRCTAGLMNYPLKFGAPPDAGANNEWGTHGYGANPMAMGLNVKFLFVGVQLERTGQAGMIGRYGGVHWHVNSYIPYGQPGSGTYLGDLDRTVNAMKYCSVLSSSNRAAVLHGCCGPEVSYNVFANTDGHVIMFEDGSERRCKVHGNLISKNNNPGYGKGPIKLHEIDRSTHFPSGNQQNCGNSGPAAVWFTNPDNDLQHNIIAETHVGIWDTFAQMLFTYGPVTGTRVGTGLFSTLSVNWASTYSRDNRRENVVPETLTFTATTPTNFSIVGSVSGAIGNVTVGSVNWTYHAPGDPGLVTDKFAPWAYAIAAHLGGGTAFQVGDQFILPLIRTGGCFGATRDANCDPISTALLAWNNNEIHSTKYKHIISAQPVINEAGDTYYTQGGNNSDFYYPATGLSQVYVDNSSNGHMWNWGSAKLWKGEENFIFHRVQGVLYNGWQVSALRNKGGIVGSRDTVGFKGVVNGRFLHWTVNPYTLDHPYVGIEFPHVFISYHEGVTHSDCLFNNNVPNTTLLEVNYTGNPYYQHLIVGKGDLMEFYDFYENPYEAGFKRHYNCALIGPNPGLYGWRTPPHWQAKHEPRFGVSHLLPNFAGPSGDGSEWMQGQAGANPLPADGSMFGRSGWHVFAYTTDANDGFYTYGTTGGVWADSVNDYPQTNGKIVDASYNYAGFRPITSAPVGLWPMKVCAVNFIRMNTAGTTVIDTVPYPLKTNQAQYGHMRHVGVMTSSNLTAAPYYKVEWTNRSHVPLPTAFTFQLWNVPLGQKVVLEIDWDGSDTPSLVRLVADVGTAITFEALAGGSKAAIVAETTSKYWIDVPNNKMLLSVVHEAPGLFNGQPPIDLVNGSMFGNAGRTEYQMAQLQVT